jgi:hypothetical protein
MPRYYGKDKAPDEPGKKDAEGHMPRSYQAPKSREKDEAAEEPEREKGDEPKPNETARVKF